MRLKCAPLFGIARTETNAVVVRTMRHDCSVPIRLVGERDLCLSVSFMSASVGEALDYRISQVTKTSTS